MKGKTYIFLCLLLSYLFAVGQTSNKKINEFLDSKNEIGNKQLVDNMFKYFKEDSVSIFVRIHDLKFCIDNIYEPTNALRSEFMGLEVKMFDDLFLLKLMLSDCHYCNPYEILKIQRIHDYYYRLVSYYPSEYKIYFLGLFETYNSHVITLKKNH